MNDQELLVSKGAVPVAVVGRTSAVDAFTLIRLDVNGDDLDAAIDEARA